MTVNSVTYRDYGWRQSGRLPPTRTATPAPSLRLPGVAPYRPIARAAKTGSIFKAPGIASRGSSSILTPISGTLRAQQLRALKTLARKLRPKHPGFDAGELALRGLSQYLRQVNDTPVGFPGWGSIDAWRGPAQEPLGYAPGDYVPNPFDHSPTWTSFRVAALDGSTCRLPVGCQFWGDFPGYDPTAPGAPDPFLSTEPVAIPQPHGLTKPRPFPRYHKQPDLAPEPEPSPYGPRNTIGITVGTTLRDGISIELNPPRLRDRKDKASPADALVWSVLHKFANALGETKEWIDIFAEAAGYTSRLKDMPKSLYGKQTAQKAYYLFAMGGFNNIDVDLLAHLIHENNVEDAMFGFLGQLSKAASRRLGLSVGLQTGLLM